MSNSSSQRSVTLVVDGIDELDVRLDDLESKLEDALVLIKVLSEQIVKLESKKSTVKKPVAKKTTKKKAVK